MKNNLTFTGKISEIREAKTGSTAKGEWAAIDFEITEDDAEYPQSGLFSMFKNGDNIKFARDFKEYYKLGDMVTVSFNMDKNVYRKKDGSGEGIFYKNSAWRVERMNKEPLIDISQPVDQTDDLPF